MKTTLKILELVFVIAFTMLSCEKSKPSDAQPPFSPEDFYELHHNIRPTKPIRIPDTMRISSAHPKVYNPQLDTIPTIPQDSIAQDSIAY